MIKKLNEDTSLKFKNISPEEKTAKGILGRLYGPVASFAAPTRNGRHYGQDLWEKLFNSDLIKERFKNGGIFGELCHPDYEDVNMEKVAIVMPEPPVKDNKGDLIAYVDIVDTPCGRIAYQLAKYGYKFGISSRGTGDIIEDYNGNEEVDPDTYQLNAFDLVEIPAVENARLSFVESLDSKKKYGKTLKEKLTEELNKASEADKKIMNETLNNLDINLNESDEYVASVGGCKIYKDGNTYKTSCDGKELKSDDFDRLVNLLKGRNMNESNTKHYMCDECGYEVDLTDDEYTGKCPNCGSHHGFYAEGLNEKLVEPSEEDLKPIEDKFAELGLEVERKGKTLFGNVHYQLRKELDHKVTKDDLGPIFDELCDLDTENMPTVCNVGVHRDGDNIISASLDVLEKQVNEELEHEDGWGDHIQGQLEQTFGNLEDLMYEVRNAVRGSYAVNGDTVQDLVGELRDLADQLSMNADDLEFEQDSLNEDIPTDHDKQRELMGILSRINAMTGRILEYDKQYDYNSEKDKMTKAFLNDDLNKIQKACEELAKFNKESVSEDGCSDKEDQVVEEDAGNTREDLMKELQEALSRNGELEKDNLSLQEKLSVCSAKEIKLNEELKRYKQASSSLSSTSKKVKDLEEELEKANKKLDYKDKLIESKNERLSNLISFKKDNILKLTESDSKISDLENQIKVLKESVEKSDKKLSDMTILAKKYQRALKESKQRYLNVKADACGLSVDSVKAQLSESYNYKEIDSVCDKLVEEKLNMSKLPFRLNENTQFKVKSSQNEYIKGSKNSDDEVSDYLLSMIK